MDPNTEIRRLKPAELYTLARILASSDSWKTLMAVVPKEGTEDVSKFTTEHFALIERASYEQRKSGAEIFLEEWSTMGKRRPTLSSTLDLLVRAQLFRAADYVAVDLLKQPPPERPTSGPAAPIHISDEELANMMNQRSSESEIPDSRIFGSKESLDSVLDGIDYPSQLSAENAVKQPEEQTQNETRQLGMECAGLVSNLRISPVENANNNSNLMQFSKSDAQNPNSNSNLMKFSTDSIPSTKTNDLAQRFPLANGVCNTNLSKGVQIVVQRHNITCTSSSDNNAEYSAQQMIRKEDIRVQRSSANTSSTSVSGNGSVSDSDNCNVLELQTSELPAFVADIGRGSTSAYSRNELQSSDLPQFVAEIAHRRSNRLEASVDAESYDEPVISNDSTSSDVSSNFLTNVTSSSHNNTESNIPICVNFDSGSLGNQELLSTELPQFVADLGHRQRRDNSTESIVQSEDNLRELKSAELPTFVVEL